MEMEGHLAEALPRWLLDAIGSRHLVPAPDAAPEALQQNGSGGHAAAPGGRFTMPLPLTAAVMANGQVTHIRAYLLDAESLNLHTTAPSSDDLLIHVPGTTQVIYIPRQMVLQRMAGTLRLQIGSILIREEGGGFTACIYMTVPNSLPMTHPVQLPFEGELMPTPYAAVESAAETAIRYLRTQHHIQVDDVNREFVLELRRKLATAESFQMLHQEAAEAAIQAAARDRQAYEVLLRQHTELQHKHDTLLQVHGVLRQDHDGLFQLHGLLRQDHDGLVLQHGLLREEHDGLVLQHQHDQQNYLHQHGLLQQKYDTLFHDHDVLTARYTILTDRYDHAIDSATTICLNSSGLLPINHLTSQDANGSITVRPVYAGANPPMQRTHKLASSLTRLSRHKRETENLLLRYY